MRKFDVIVTGSGPSGSMAACILACAGFHVALIDKAIFPRPKVCGGLLTWKTLQILESVLGLSLARLQDAKIVHHQSSGYTVYGHKGPLLSGELFFPLSFVNRALFDDYLVYMAQVAGAYFFPEKRAVRCQADSGRLFFEDGSFFQGKFIIGADGANSIVRRSFPFLPREHSVWREKTAMAVEAYIPAEYFPRAIQNPELYIGHIIPGYGWVFPAEKGVYAGLCGLKNKGENFSQKFKGYLDILKIASNAPVQAQAHPLPYGSYLAKPSYGRCLLVGDAAGFVEPFLGEGIFFALISGLYAARAIVEHSDSHATALKYYTRHIESQLLTEFRGADRLRGFLFWFLEVFGESQLQKFMKLIQKRLENTVHGVCSYSWMQPKKWDFLS